ncbi:MAG: POTRA domain-containing protein [Bacteroidota bacterium]
MNRRFYTCLISTLIAGGLFYPSTSAQATPLSLNYMAPDSYLIQDIRVTGNTSLDTAAIIALSGLQVGDTILLPGPTITDAIQRLWQQKLVRDIAIYAQAVEKGTVILTIHVTENLRLSSYTFKGIKKKQIAALEEKANLTQGQVVTQALLQKIRKTIQDYWAKEGYLNATTHISTEPDPEHENCVQLTIHTHQGEKRIINEIQFEGNHQLDSAQLKAAMQHIRERPRVTLVQDLLKQTLTLKPIRKGGFLWRPVNVKGLNSYFWEHVILFSSKFDQAQFEADQQRIIDCYRSHGFRDAKIVAAQVEEYDTDSLNVKINVQEGTQYRIRSIRWAGNYLHSDEELNEILNMQPGDLYNAVLLKQRLNSNPEGSDVSSLYYNDGYLFFRADPVEVGLTDNTVDLEIRIQEGPQAYINKVIIEGNTLTHDYVIRRELRTLPGDKFSRAKVMRSYRELSLLNIFDPAIDIQPIPNPADGTVDIKYRVNERPKAEIKATASWGGEAHGLIGALVLGTNNFSARDLFRFKKWRPIGAGQALNLKAELNGSSYKGFSMQFMEPWLGGARPTSLSFTLSVSSQTRLGERFKNDKSNSETLSVLGSTSDAAEDKKKYGEASLSVVGGRVGLGRRLSWPSDYFTLRSSFSYYRHSYKNYNFLGKGTKMDGVNNDLALQVSLERNSIDSPIYPTKGSIVGLHTRVTPIPFSLFSSEDYSKLPEEQKLKWTEYHQWMLDASYFLTLVEKLVLCTKGHFGILGGFSSKLGTGPFKRFFLGGGGMSGQTTLLAEEDIALRGYPDEYFRPQDKKNSYLGGVIYDKFVVELRYPIIESYLTHIHALAFAEAGNTWGNYSDYTFFDLKKSAGVGIRIYLPFLIGTTINLDWGYGFDRHPADRQQDKLEFHFSMGMNLR